MKNIIVNLCVTPIITPNLKIILGFSLLLLSACSTSNVVKFNIHEDVSLVQKSPIRMDKLESWLLFKTDIPNNEPFCSSYTSYHSNSTVLGQEVITKTTPRTNVACTKAFNFSQQEKRDYELLRVAYEALKLGVDEFFQFNDIWWLPLGEGSVLEFEKYFVPSPGDTRLIIYAKGRNIDFNSIPHKRELVKTSHLFYVDSKTGLIWDEQMFKVDSRYDFETNYEFKKRVRLESKGVKTNLNLLFNAESISELLASGRLVAHQHEVRGSVPILPKPYETAEIIRRLEGAYTIKK